MRSRQRSARGTAPSAWARSNTPSAPSACAEDRGRSSSGTGVRASPGISRSRSCPSSESGRRAVPSGAVLAELRKSQRLGSVMARFTSRRAMRARLSSVRPRKVRVSFCVCARSSGVSRLSVTRESRPSFIPSRNTASASSARRWPRAPACTMPVAGGSDLSEMAESPHSSREAMCLRGIRAPPLSLTSWSISRSTACHTWLFWLARVINPLSSRRSSSRFSAS